jgi:hypothetical protein
VTMPATRWSGTAFISLKKPKAIALSRISSGRIDVG